jgi:ADP-ribosylglycohydrolase
MADDPSPLIGEGVADALGMPFETMSASDPLLLEWDGSYLPSEYHQLNPGQWTDDTMMAKLLMESLFICGGFYPRDISERYLHWYLAGPLRGMGKTTKASMQRLKGGIPWNDSGIEGAEGNGTAMRIAPMGAFYHEDPLTAAEFARVEARITHKSLEADEGSAAVAVMTALTWKGVSKSALLGETLPFLRESKIKEKLTYLGDIQDKATLEEAFRIFGTRAHVVQTVPSAAAAFILTDSYVDAVTSAIRNGGDTDTTAAVTGALAGTYYGFAAIPKKYKTQLESIDHFRKLESKINVGPSTSVLWRI